MSLIKEITEAEASFLFKLNIEIAHRMLEVAIDQSERGRNIVSNALVYSVKELLPKMELVHYRDVLLYKEKDIEQWTRQIFEKEFVKIRLLQEQQEESGA